MLTTKDIAREIYLRIDQGEDVKIPPLRTDGVNEIVKAVFDIITQAIAVGEKVNIHKFGTFDPSVKPERKARNPRTGEVINVPEKLSLKFKPQLGLRKALSEADVSVIKDLVGEKIKAAKKGRKTEDEKPSSAAVNSKKKKK